MSYIFRLKAFLKGKPQTASKTAVVDLLTPYDVNDENQT
jgi:hypothetical protein